MIPRHLSLVTQLPEREAAINAILHVEENPKAVNRRQPYPYARAFFRFLTGSSKISSRSLNSVRGVYWLKEDKIPLASYEEAIDRLIRSRGKYCWYPLDDVLAHTLFPEHAFSVSERQDKRNKREAVQYSRQEERRAQEKEDKYRTLVGKAEIDLAFQTPETLKAWHACWSQQDIRDYDIQCMLWAWTERCPSLAHLFRGWYDTSLEIALDVHDVAAESTEAQRELERWLVPNKITLKEVWP
ncbi:plasmid SOS inhibition protein A [Salmonella enterica]|nr:plasmid SOS inhibition protein A [Salmonella enterica]